MKEKIATALHPSKLRTSGKMSALLAVILGVVWTSPALAELYATSDGIILGRLAGDIGANEWIGTRADYFHNVEGCADTVGLSKTEKRELLRLAHLAIGESGKLRATGGR
jgi:hypothetical protein